MASVSGGTWRSLSIKRSFGLLMIPIVLLTVISLSLWQLLRVTLNPRWGYVFLSDFFNLDREVNIPTWFTAALWLATGVLAAFFARKTPNHRRSWWLFSVVCLFFSIDESTSLHERLNPAGAVLTQRFDIGLRYGWVIPGTVIAAVLILFLLRFVLALPLHARLGVFLAGILFVSGAVVGEILGDLSLRGTPLLEVPNSPTYIAFNAMEEFLEMTGVALCLASLLSLISWRQNEDATVWKVTLDSTPPAHERSSQC